LEAILVGILSDKALKDDIQSKQRGV